MPSSHKALKSGSTKHRREKKVKHRRSQRVNKHKSQKHAYRDEDDSESDDTSDSEIESVYEEKPKRTKKHKSHKHALKDDSDVAIKEEPDSDSDSVVSGSSILIPETRILPPRSSQTRTSQTGTSQTGTSQIRTSQTIPTPIRTPQASQSVPTPIPMPIPGAAQRIPTGPRYQRESERAGNTNQIPPTGPRNQRENDRPSNTTQIPPTGPKTQAERQNDVQSKHIPDNHGGHQRERKDSMSHVPDLRRFLRDDGWWLVKVDGRDGCYPNEEQVLASWLKAKDELKPPAMKEISTWTDNEVVLRLEHGRGVEQLRFPILGARGTFFKLVKAANNVKCMYLLKGTSVCSEQAVIDACVRRFSYTSFNLYREVYTKTRSQAFQLLS
jgi:hypothetical protein